MKKLFFKNWIPISYFFLFMVLAILIQGGWALWDYRPETVCNWRNCDVLVDLFLMSLPPTFFICMLNISFFIITSGRVLSTLVTIFVLMASCLIIDTEIFADRQALWIAYENAWKAGFSLAIGPIVSTSLIFTYPLYRLAKKISFCSEC